MTITLYFDTATTGLWNWKDKEAPQPHLLRLAMALDDGSGRFDPLVLIATPEPGWVFEPGAVQTHGITAAYARAHGEALAQIIATFGALQTAADRLVGFSVDFHARVVRHAASELGSDIELPKERLTCCMRAATNIVRIPRDQPGGGWKWPKMSEAYRHFAGAPLPQEPDPIASGRAVIGALWTIDRGIQAAQAGAAA